MSDIRKFIDIIGESEKLDEFSPFSWLRRKKPESQPIDLKRAEIGKRQHVPQAPKAAEPDKEVPARTPVPTEHRPAKAAQPVFQDGVPDLGLKFTYGARPFVVTGYMRDANIGTPMFGKRNVSLVACRRDQAGYVIGMGGAGCVAPIKDIVPTGQWADWSHEQKQHVVSTAIKLAKQGWSIKRPEGI